MFGLIVFAFAIACFSPLVVALQIVRLRELLVLTPFEQVGRKAFQHHALLLHFRPVRVGWVLGSVKGARLVVAQVCPSPASCAQEGKASYPPPMLLAHWPPIRDIQMVPMVFSNGAPPMLLSHWRSLEGIKWVPMVFANGSKALGKSIGFSI